MNRVSKPLFAAMHNDSTSLADSHSEYDAGKVAFYEGNYVQAAEHFMRSVAIYPHFKALELLGESWLKQERSLDAIVPLAAASFLNKGSRAPALLAHAFITLGDKLKANNAALCALERDPCNKMARAIIDLIDESPTKDE